MSKVLELEREPVLEDDTKGEPERKPQIMQDLLKKKKEVDELRERNTFLNAEVNRLKAMGLDHWEKLFQSRLNKVISEKESLQKKLNRAEYALGVIRAAMRGVQL